MPTPSKKPFSAKKSTGISDGQADARVIASRVVAAVLASDQTLDTALELKSIKKSSVGKNSSTVLSSRDRAFVQALCYSVFRHYHRLDFLLKKLLTQPASKLPAPVRACLLLGLAQIDELETADHAAVNESVSATKKLGFSALSGMVNAVLRRFIRERDQLLSTVGSDEQARWEHPAWLLQQLQKDWPEVWQDIATANNQLPPLWLRANQRHNSRDQYVQRDPQLAAGVIKVTKPETALGLKKPLPIAEIPGFNDGDVSIQDISSQWICELVQPTAGCRLLDACAAPGGKLCALLERFELIATAVDISRPRLQKVKDSLHRLGLSAKCVSADATQLQKQFGDQSFDIIIIDAPCSGTGVIRRHPDIKISRNQRQVSEMVELQQRLLKGLWPMLKRGGRMVYSTCSVLRDENDRQIGRFLAQTKNAAEGVFELPVGQRLEHGWQVLPGQADSGNSDGDGFFYACIDKQQ
ncbi:MAG: 16S rRNA (cytosine(967)-C(5))-methyltransferase RsmB [Gammaproteobacteria bacterium]|nr:16S rRNA (cytosine(967)-C(5))-methyltransferase RsmB [Gammaproteobacteria bacterium]